MTIFSFCQELSTSFLESDSPRLRLLWTLLLVHRTGCSPWREASRVTIHRHQTLIFCNTAHHGIQRTLVLVQWSCRGLPTHCSHQENKTFSTHSLTSGSTEAPEITICHFFLKNKKSPYFSLLFLWASVCACVCVSVHGCLCVCKSHHSHLLSLGAPKSRFLSQLTNHHNRKSFSTLILISGWQLSNTHFPCFFVVWSLNFK